MGYNTPAPEGDSARRYTAQDEALWLWVAAVLRDEHRRLKYAQDMFPQAEGEIRASRLALLEAASCVEFRAGRIPITPAPPSAIDRQTDSGKIPSTTTQT